MRTAFRPCNMTRLCDSVATGWNKGVISSTTMSTSRSRLKRADPSSLLRSFRMFFRAFALVEALVADPGEVCAFLAVAAVSHISATAPRCSPLLVQIDLTRGSYSQSGVHAVRSARIMVAPIAEEVPIVFPRLSHFQGLLVRRRLGPWLANQAELGTDNGEPPSPPSLATTKTTPKERRYRVWGGDGTQERLGTAPLGATHAENAPDTLRAVCGQEYCDAPRPHENVLQSNHCRTETVSLLAAAHFGQMLAVREVHGSNNVAALLCTMTFLCRPRRRGLL